MSRKEYTSNEVISMLYLLDNALEVLEDLSLLPKLAAKLGVEGNIEFIEFIKSRPFGMKNAKEEILDGEKSG